MPAPNKLFDIKNGNGVVDGAETVTRGTLIWYGDNAAKDKVIDRFCAAYGYQDNIDDPNNPGQQIPNPQGRQAFFNARLTDFIKDVVKAQAIREASATAAATADSTETTDLP